MISGSLSLNSSAARARYGGSAHGAACACCNTDGASARFGAIRPRFAPAEATPDQDQAIFRAARRKNEKRALQDPDSKGLSRAEVREWALMETIGGMPDNPFAHKAFDRHLGKADGHFRDLNADAYYALRDAGASPEDGLAYVAEATPPQQRLIGNGARIGALLEQIGALTEEIKRACPRIEGD